MHKKVKEAIDGVTNGDIRHALETMYQHLSNGGADDALDERLAEIENSIHHLAETKQDNITINGHALSEKPDTSFTIDTDNTEHVEGTDESEPLVEGGSHDEENT